ncbi:MAG: leucine-rich repeat domain-containing protein, partial [Paludibacter sp.]
DIYKFLKQFLTIKTNSNYVTSIGNAAFHGCTKLTGDLVIPNSVTSIGMDAFSSCTGITGNLIIGNSVTTIQNYAFQYCYGITSLTLGTTLNSIGSCVFQYCNLKSINCLSIVPPTLQTLGGNAFTGINKNTCTLYVPVGSYTKYLTATGWTDFINIIEGTSGINDISNEKIKIYPNPVIESFRIDGIDGNATLRLTDMDGKLLIEQMIQKSDFVSVGKLPKGVYFVRLITNEGVVEKKVIKN